MSSTLSYSPEFYAEHAALSLESARRVVPIILQHFSFSSVIDVGCGAGAWLKAFKENGLKDVLGIDSDYVPESSLLINSTEFLRADLTQPIEVGRRFDLAVSLEVAEHLPAEVAMSFAESLTRLAPLVIFSAAYPGQGGTNHINEQWPGYWKRLFAELGYNRHDLLRPLIWRDAAVSAWYRTNIFVFSYQSTSIEIDQYNRIRARIHALNKYARGWAKHRLGRAR